MRRFITLVLSCYVAVNAQFVPLHSEAHHGVRRPNNKDDYDVDAVQRLPSSDVDLMNNVATANQLMSQLQQYSKAAASTEEEDRDLQLDIGTIIQITTAACNLVGTLMLLEGTAVCDCTLSLELEFGCQFEENVCLSNFCSTPEVSGSFDILQTVVAFTYCAEDAAFNDIELPSFCVTVSGDITQPSAARSNSSSVSETPDDKKRLFGKGKFLQKVQFLDTISVKVGDRECRSASICNNGQGYIFDCTNINSLLKQSTCTPIQTLTSLQQAPGSVTFLPQLDDPPTPAPVASFSDLFNNFQSLFQMLQNP